MRFAIFPFHPSKVLRLPRKSDAQVIQSAGPVTQNHLSKPEDLMLQNATSLRKSLPGPRNSDEHVFCTAPATENASLQILLKCPTRAIFFGNVTRPHILLTFGKVQNPLPLPRKIDARSYEVLHLPRKNILANLQI